MAYLRGASRHVTQTISDYLSAQMGALGWMDPANLPWAATQVVTLLDYVPKPSGLPTDVNTVAFTAGTENDDKPGETGAASGGLFWTEYVFFLDIFGENQSIASAIADDLKAILTGKLANTNRWQAVTDYSQVPPAPAAGYDKVEFTDIVRTRPLHSDYQRDWQIVKFTACHWYDASERGGG